MSGFRLLFTKSVYGAGVYTELAPKAPKILPEWSPVKLFGSYYKQR